MRSTVSSSGSTSDRNVSWSIRTAWRRARPCSEAGNSSRCGIDAPSTSTGTTRMPRWRAAETSSTMKSSGASSLRRPTLSVIVVQALPIRTMRTSQDATAAAIASPKSTPGSRDSTSMNTFVWPSLFSSQSESLPAMCCVSRRR